MKINKIQKTLILLLSIFFFTTNPSYSADIYDVDIFGYEISQSLLDHFTSDEIQGMKKVIEGSTQGIFTRINYPRKQGGYDGMQFLVKTEDSMMIIYAITAYKSLGNENLELCMSKKRQIVNDLSKIYSQIKSASGISTYDIYDGKSKSYQTEFFLEEARIIVSCTDWSPIVEENTRYQDNLRYIIMSDIYNESRNR